MNRNMFAQWKGFGVLILIGLLMLAACGAPAPAAEEPAMEPAAEEADTTDEAAMMSQEAPHAGRDGGCW